MLSEFWSSIKAPPAEQIDAKYYIAAICIWQIIFWACYSLTEKFMESKKDWKEYVQLTPDKKADYLSRVVANIHAVFACIAAYISIFWCW